MASVLVSRCRKQVERNLATYSFPQTWPPVGQTLARLGEDGKEMDQQRAWVPSFEGASEDGGGGENHFCIPFS